MPKQQFVVKLNATDELYLLVYSPVFENCQWTSADNASTWNTLAEAQAVATLIGHGTVGTTKP